jgi:hypothetical protein
MSVVELHSNHSPDKLFFGGTAAKCNISAVLVVAISTEEFGA